MRERVEREGLAASRTCRTTSQEAARALGRADAPRMCSCSTPSLSIVYEGAPDADHEDPALRAAWLRDGARRGARGRRADPAETEPVGCSIKWS